MSQDKLAERMGISKATISRIENRQSPYSQDFLEACADALDCDPADLITRDPTAPEAVWSVWQSIPAADKPRAIELLKVFASCKPVR